VKQWRELADSVKKHGVELIKPIKGAALRAPERDAMHLILFRVHELRITPATHIGHGVIAHLQFGRRTHNIALPWRFSNPKRNALSDHAEPTRKKYAQFRFWPHINLSGFY
jgi:hypothetical protein